MIRKTFANGIAGLFILGGLYLSSLYNYLLFHSLAEIFSVVIACAIFMFAWNSRRLLKNDYLLFLGIAYLFIAGLDLVHTLAYNGMNIFSGYGANLPTQLWIATRYMESMSLFIAPFVLDRKIRRPFVFFAYGAATVIILAALFSWNVFPDCYIEGTGLTAFKKLSEYIICLILAGAGAMLFRKREHFDKHVLRLLVSSIAITIAAELVFTFYVSVYGLSNLIGHFLKIVSFYLIYRAIVSTGLMKPYDIIFRDLNRSEESLRREKDFTNSLIETAPVIILVLDTKGRIVQFNPHMEILSGYRLDEVKGKDWISTFVPEDERGRIGKLFVQAEGGFHTAGNINRIMTRDGREVFIEWYDTVLKAADGSTLGVLAVGQDVTERKRAGEQIREYSEKLEKMVEERTGELSKSLDETEAARIKIDGILKSVADGLIVTDPWNRIEMMNPAAEYLLGIRFCDVMHSSIETAIGDETLGERLKETLDRKITGEQFDFEVPGVDTGNAQIMRARTSVIRDTKDEDAGIVTIINDVTYEREVDRMKTEFVSTMAHELKTPLTSIMGFSELLVSRGDLAENEKKKFLSHIVEKSKQLNAIINDILDISQIEGGQGFSLEYDVFDFSELIKETVSQFKEQQESRPFMVTLPESPVELRADRKKMHKVFRNIFSNAIKFSPVNSPVTVTAEHSKGSYRVAIGNEGIGMAPEQVENIFDKFYRADMSNSAKSGTGLGMSIVKHIVEAHGGRVWIESEPGKGTTVWFTVPAEV